MKVKYTVDVITSATLYGAELDIPDDIVSRGEAAMVAWCNSRIMLVDMAQINHIETCVVKSVSDIRKEE